VHPSAAPLFHAGLGVAFPVTAPYAKLPWQYVDEHVGVAPRL
jgi:hypothetical protein